MWAAKVAPSLAAPNNGTNLLRARRLVERGVRFIQPYSGQSSSWDAHRDIEQNHGQISKIVDKPVAGLLTDL